MWDLQEVILQTTTQMLKNSETLLRLTKFCLSRSQELLLICPGKRTHICIKQCPKNNWTWCLAETVEIREDFLQSQSQLGDHMLSKELMNWNWVSNTWLNNWIRFWIRSNSYNYGKITSNTIPWSFKYNSTKSDKVFVKIIQSKF